MFARKKSLEDKIAEFIFMKSPDAYWVMENDKVIACNEAMARMIGATVPQVIGLHPARFSLETQPNGLNSNEAIKPMLGELQKSGMVRFEWWVQTLNGNKFPVYATLMVAPIDGRVLVVCFWQNISETVALREEQAKVRLAAEALASEQQAAIETISEGLQHLANGDLSFQISRPMSGDFDGLRQNFNSSVERLEDMVIRITSTAEAIETGTREIASSADDLSRRTEQQAASLEETAAALNEITSNVSNSNTMTGDARKLARLATDSAEKSADVVAEAEDAMRRIETSSQQISNIIGVIDEIAFQTNLLALNAGVEAARAGEAGKGFAVVAQEVRELAQRSANAAKEIKALINNSSTEVDSGVRLVGDTGQTLKTISDYILQVYQKMEMIATSSSEQASGLSEVNVAITRMDQTTQQNAAMVEQSTAASVALANEATLLRQAISQFRIRQARSSNGDGQVHSRGGYARSA